MLVFENIGHKYDFQGGGVGGGPYLKKKKVINTYLLCRWTDINV